MSICLFKILGVVDHVTRVTLRWPVSVTRQSTSAARYVGNGYPVDFKLTKNNHFVCSAVRDNVLTSLLVTDAIIEMLSLRAYCIGLLRVNTVFSFLLVVVVLSFQFPV